MKLNKKQFRKIIRKEAKILLKEKNSTDNILNDLIKSLRKYINEMEKKQQNGMIGSGIGKALNTVLDSSYKKHIIQNIKTELH